MLGLAAGWQPNACRDCFERSWRPTTCSRKAVGMPLGRPLARNALFADGYLWYSSKNASNPSLKCELFASRSREMNDGKWPTRDRTMRCGFTQYSGGG